MNHLPRKGQYELFTFNHKTYSFDDPTFGSDPAIINAPTKMFEWLRAQPECRPLGECNTAYYLTPKLYLIWKLKWT